MLKLQKYVDEPCSVLSVFFDYVYFLTPAMRNAFCVLILHLVDLRRLRFSVKGSFVLNGRDGVVKVEGFSFCRCCFELMFLGVPLATVFDGV